MAYSLPGTEDPIRKKIYRSFRGQPSDQEREQGESRAQGQARSPSPTAGRPSRLRISLSSETPTIDYFRQFPGLDAGAAYDGPGFWELPIPVMKSIEVALRDVVIYDGEGYPALRDFLKKQGIRHVLLAGYNTDMCVCSTTAGYKNLSQDFDVFLVGDATIATFPAQPTPRFATTSAVCFAALNLFITQASWVRPSRRLERTLMEDSKMNRNVPRITRCSRFACLPDAASALGARCWQVWRLAARVFAALLRQRQGPDRHHARPGDEPELPDLGPDALGLREGEPRRRDQAVRGRGRPAGQGQRRRDPLLRRRPDDGAGGRRLAARRSSRRAIRSAITRMTTSTSRRRDARTSSSAFAGRPG